MNTRLPNFLIAGNAKCGTSSLHNYLAQHPQIFMSSVKEPRFITSQFTTFPLGGPRDHQVESWYVKDYEAYKALFEGVKNEIAVGESSADTMYFYKESIPVIRQYLGDPKIILMLRNPIKRAFSAYQHLVRDARESLSFEDALLAEPERIEKNFELIYHYKAVSLYADAVEAFIKNFTHVKVILNEDLERKPAETLRDIFNFLGVEAEVAVNTSIRYNMSGVPKSRWIHEFLFEGNSFRKLIQPIIRKVMSHEKRKKLSYKIQEMNLKRLNINPDTKTQLEEFFYEDVIKLQSLLKRDLSGWISAQPTLIPQ